VNLSGLVGYTGGHVLGNFSVTKQRGEVGTGFSAKLKDLLQGIADYQVVVESGGRVIPGGHQQFMMAAKGLFDSEVAPGRTWVVTGMGANAESGEMWSSTGGRGKTMKFFFLPPLGCLGRFSVAEVSMKAMVFMIALSVSSRAMFAEGGNYCRTFRG
jgi:hypothetical protein